MTNKIVLKKNTQIVGILFILLTLYLSLMSIDWFLKVYLNLNKLKPVTKALTLEQEYKKEAMTYAEHHAKVSKEAQTKAIAIAKEQEEQMARMMDEINKVTKKIEEQSRQELFLQKSVDDYNLGNNTLKKFPFKKIIGGKN